MSGGMVRVYVDGTPHWRRQSEREKTRWHDLPRVRVRVAPGSDKFCVYAHIVNGEIFYIGSGQIDRAFERCGRNDVWSRVVQEAGEYDVQIMLWCRTRKTALIAELTEITKYSPKANIQKVSDTLQIQNRSTPMKDL